MQARFAFAVMRWFGADQRTGRSRLLVYTADFVFPGILLFNWETCGESLGIIADPLNSPDCRSAQ